MKQMFSFLAMFRRDRRPGDLVFAVGFFVFAVAVVLVLPQQATFLPGRALITQPGFWPAIGAAMMLLFGAVHLLGTLNAPRLPGPLREVMVWARSLEFVVWFILYVLAVPRLGYLPSTVLLAVLLGARLGYRSPRTLAASVLFAVAVVLVFRTGLGVRVPAGAIYSHLPDAIRTFAMTHF